MGDPSNDSLLIHSLSRLDASLRDLTASQQQQTHMVGQLLARIEAHEHGLMLVRDQLSDEVSRIHTALDGVVKDYQGADVTVHQRIEEVERQVNTNGELLHSWVNRGWGVSAMLGVVLALAGFLLNLTTDQYRTTIAVLTQRIDALEQLRKTESVPTTTGK